MSIITSTTRQLRLFTVIILFIVPAVSAQTKTYTLNDAVFTALDNNADIKVAKMEIEKSEHAVNEAFGYALPTLDFTTNFAHFIQKPKTSFPDFGSLLSNATYQILFDEKVLPQDNNKFKPVGNVLQSFALSNSFTSQFTLSQVLFNSAVFRGIGASHIYLNLAQENLKAVTANTILNVKKAFYGVLLAQEMLNITEASLKNAEDNLQNVTAYYKQGLVSEFDQLQVEVHVENIRPKVQDLQKTVQDAKNGLKILLGVDQSQDISVTGEFTYEPEILEQEDVMVNSVLNNNLDLNTFEIKRQVDEEFIALERADYWPMLTAFGNYAYAGSSDNLNFQTYSSTTVGLNLSINLFRGFRANNRVDQAIIGVKETDEQISQMKDLLSKEVKSQLMELGKVQSQIDAIERNVQLAEKAYQIATTRYKEGTATQLDIKNADLELSTAKVNRIQSIYNYIISKAELDKLLGKVSDKYLEHVQQKDSK